MDLAPEVMRARVARARVARLATVDADTRPHVVPIVFAVDGDALWFVIDAKPKRTSDVRRVRNIAANPAVSVLVDHYDEDWTRLWWVRLDGRGRVLRGDDEQRDPVMRLRDRYPQYRDMPLAGPVVEVAIERWRGWSAS